MIQQTSLTAYQTLDLELRNKTYNSILEVLKRWQDGLTDREISEILGYSDPNKIRPRRNELVKKGLIVEGFHRKCRIGKKQAITWVSLTKTKYI